MVTTAHCVSFNAIAIYQCLAITVIITILIIIIIMIITMIIIIIILESQTGNFVSNKAHYIIIIVTIIVIVVIIIIGVVFVQFTRLKSMSFYYFLLYSFLCSYLPLRFK